MTQLRYRSQRVAYGYFLAALLLFVLQLAFGFLSLAKYLGPDPLRDVLNFATTKEIHTNLLLVWLLTGFMGAAYYVVPEESHTELHSERLAWLQLGLWLAIGGATRGCSLLGITEARKSLEMPLPLKLGVVAVMLLFLYNLGATIRKAIHQVDLLLWFAGPVREVFGMWQLGAAHAIESEDLVSATLRYESGATGVIQAATRLWPG